MSVEPLKTPAPPTSSTPKEIVIVSHSNLFYWWPVWAVGFLLGGLSLVAHSKMAVVPRDTKAYAHATVVITEKTDGEEKQRTLKDREVLVVESEKGHLPRSREDADVSKPPEDPWMHMWPTRGFGVLFATVLLLVIVITNVPLRGMWSVMVIVMIIMLSVIFALAGLWGPILEHLGHLDVRMNAGGYLFISGILFVIWLVTFVFFDKQIYMIFTPGMVKVCTEIGGGEETYDTVGITLKKQRSDLFRHWVLGLGSGDLIVDTAGARPHHAEMPNVLFIGKKKKQVEEMLKTRTFIETK